jgi:hypothetical protein
MHHLKERFDDVNEKKPGLLSSCSRNDAIIYLLHVFPG